MAYPKPRRKRAPFGRGPAPSAQLGGGGASQFRRPRKKQGLGGGASASIGHRPGKTLKKHKLPGKLGSGAGDGGSGGDSGFLTDALTPGKLRDEMRAASRLEFRPTERAINADLLAEQHRGQQIPAWFQEYQDKLKGAAKDTADAYQKADTNFRAQLKEAGNQDTSARQDLTKSAQDDAKLRGVAEDNSAAQDATNAAASRQSLQARFSGAVGQQGANQAAYLADKSRVGKGEDINQRFKSAARERGIRGDLRELAGRKGDFNVKYLSDARQSERANDLDNRTLAQELQMQRENNSFQGKQAGLDRQLQRRGTATTRASQGYNNALNNQSAATVASARITANSQISVAKLNALAKQATARGQTAVAKIYRDAARVKARGYKNLPSGGGSGGGKKKKPKGL